MSLRFLPTLLFSIALAGKAGAAETCLTDWGAAGEIVRAQGLKTVEQLAKSSPQQLKGQIVKATLCQDGGGYVYRLVVRDGAGQLKNVVLSASNHALGANSP